MPALRVCLLFAALCVGLAVPAADPPQARASEACGKQVINEYFYTGRIKYHPQECYASALKQLDPDARMYSGIMGAIRAARARDKAADTRAATPIVEPTDGDVYDDGGGAGAGSGADPLADDSALPVDPLLDPEEPIIVDPNAEALTDEISTSAVNTNAK